MDNNNNQKQSIDDFYKSKIEGGQIEFDSNGWEALENRLDDDNQERAIIDIISLWKKRWVPILLFLFIASTSVCLFMFLDNSNTLSSELDKTQLEKDSKITDSNTNEKLSDRLINTENEKNDAGLDNGLKEGVSTSENQKGNEIKQEEEQEGKQDKAKLAQGGGVDNLKKRQFIQSNSEAKISNDKRDLSNQNVNDGSKTPTSNTSSKQTNTELKESTSPAITIEDTGSNEGNILSQDGSKTNNVETEKVFDDEFLAEDVTSNQSTKTEVEQVSDVPAIIEDETNDNLEFPFLPLLQMDLVRNETEKMDGELLSPVKVEVRSNPHKLVYVKFGYAESLNSALNDGSPNIMASIGHDYKLTRNGSYGLELIYERFRNEKQTSVFINDIYIDAGRNRDALDLVTSFKWKPYQKRFSMSSFVGLGMERTSWDLESVLFYPSSNVEAARNDNRIYMKLSPFASLGGDIGYDIIKNRLSFNVTVNYQLRLKDVEVNGMLQGFRVNPSEHERAYELIEERVLKEDNLVSIYFGLKYYIF